MGTIRQKNLANEIVNNVKRKKKLNKGELVEKVGYSKMQATKKPGEIIKSKGVKEELQALGFNEYSAKQVVEELMLSKKVKPNDRLKATDQVFKVVGSYSPDKVDMRFKGWTKDQLISKLLEDVE